MTPQEQNIVANLVVQSMTDEAVRNGLLSNPTGTLTAAGVNLGPQPPTIVTVADTGTLFNVIVPLTPLGPAQQLLTLPLPSPTPFCIMVWIITNIQQNTPLAASLIADPLSVLRGMGVKYPCRRDTDQGVAGNADDAISRAALLRSNVRRAATAPHPEYHREEAPHAAARERQRQRQRERQR